MFSRLLRPALFLTVLLAGCQQSPSPQLSPDSSPVGTSPVQSEAGDLLGLFELQVNGQGRAARITTAGELQPQASVISGLSFEVAPLTVVRDVSRQVIHITAAFKVTNLSGTALTSPTFMPLVVRGTNPTVGNTPFRNIKTASGQDATARANDMKVERGTYFDALQGLFVPMAGATPLIQDLDASGLTVSAGTGRTVYDIAPLGWQGGALAAGANQVVSFGISVPMGAVASPEGQPDDVYSFSLLFAAVEQPTENRMTTMSAKELEMVGYINEVRTQGSIKGDTSVRAGTCIANFSPVAALSTDDPAATRAAKRHTGYQAFEGDLAHVEYLQNSLWFFGSTMTERIDRAESEVRMLGTRLGWGENVAYRAGQGSGYDDPAAIVLDLLQSTSGHCENMMRANFTHVGVGYRVMPEPTFPSQPRGTWTQMFTERVPFGDPS